MPEPFKCDHSICDDCDRCLRYCYFKHEAKIVNTKRRGALQYGTAMHSAADAFHAGKPVDEAIKAFLKEMPKDSEGNPMDIDEKRAVRRGEQIIRNYYVEWQSQPPTKVLEMEQMRKMDLQTTNVLTGEPLDIEYWCKLDKLIEVGNGVTFRDHKTTSLYIADYTKRARCTHQYAGYSEVVRKDFENAALSGSVDVIHIPRVYKSEQGDIGNVRTQYARIPVSYSEMEIEEWRRWVFAMVNRMLLHRKLGVWPQSKSRCWDFNSSCEYLGLCEMPMSHERQVEQGLRSGDFEVMPWEPWKGEGG